MRFPFLLLALFVFMGCENSNGDLVLRSSSVTNAQSAPVGFVEETPDVDMSIDDFTLPGQEMTIATPRGVPIDPTLIQPPEWDDEEEPITGGICANPAWTMNTACDYYNNGGFIGLGDFTSTSGPLRSLHIKRRVPNVRLQSTSTWLPGAALEVCYDTTSAACQYRALFGISSLVGGSYWYMSTPSGSRFPFAAYANNDNIITGRTYVSNYFNVDGKSDLNGRVTVTPTSPLTSPYSRLHLYMDTQAGLEEGAELVYNGDDNLERKFSITGRYSPSESWDTVFNMNHWGVGINEDPERGVALAVDGQIKAREIFITDLGWSDYVFNDEYSLMPLEEVSEFIDSNGHLPNVPSAEEVSARGVSVGETQAMLLRKIEELTLYAITQNEQIDSVREELKSLRKVAESCTK